MASVSAFYTLQILISSYNIIGSPWIVFILVVSISSLAGLLI
jgi:hypothetical protein